MKTDPFNSNRNFFFINPCFRSAMPYLGILQLLKEGFRQKYKMTEIANDL